MPPRGRYQQRQWEMREEAILHALTDLTQAHGFANVTMDDIADTVGISKATLYQHFSSKNDLLRALMLQHTRQFTDWLATTADQPPLARLQQTMRHLFAEHITPLRGLIQLGHEDITPIFETDADLIAQHTQVLDTLSAIIREGQANGTIAPDLAPQVIISAMWALSNVSMADYEPAQDKTAPLPREQYIEHMLRLFERSITPRVS
jgi:AcrR family transcriptional regulator